MHLIRVYMSSVDNQETGNSRYLSFVSRWTGYFSFRGLFYTALYKINTN